MIINFSKESPLWLAEFILTEHGDYIEELKKQRGIGHDDRPEILKIFVDYFKTVKDIKVEDVNSDAVFHIDDKLAVIKILKYCD